MTITLSEINMRLHRHREEQEQLTKDREQLDRELKELRYKIQQNEQEQREVNYHIGILEEVREYRDKQAIGGQQQNYNTQPLPPTPLYYGGRMGVR